MSICPDCGADLEAGARRCKDCGWAVGIYKTKRKFGATEEIPIVRTCPECGQIGSISDATNGGGPYYCSKHYWERKNKVDRGIEKQLDPWTAIHGHKPERIS